MLLKLELEVNLDEKNFKNLDVDEISKITKDFQEKVLINKIRYDLDLVLSRASYEKLEK